MARINEHPILTPSSEATFPLTFQGQVIRALPGEMLSSALFAAGFRTFGKHPKDGSPQGIFCANGQCSQCMVLADGIPVKACMTPAQPGMRIEPLTELPSLPDRQTLPPTGEIETLEVEVLIIGGGPAGLSAALELAEHGMDVLLIDDKDRLGGKLVLQTHRFFGSINAVHAGTRGIDIGVRLASDVSEKPTVRTWLNSTALAVFSDGIVGVLRDDAYVRIRPQMLLAATGAREKALVFPGNTLPGVYGAGAFQTLVNRDLVKAADRLFIVGGGNVGLIAGYHALQAGIDVVGLVEALPQCGGYKVHRDKLARMGVPIYTSHTVLSANGAEAVESVTISQIDEGFRPVEGTERTYACDTVLIAVGLDPVDEFTEAANRFGVPVYTAGDADEIAEASAAIFSGKITGRQIALDMKRTSAPIPEDWARTTAILKSHPGKTIDRTAPTIQTTEDSANRTFRERETPRNDNARSDGELGASPTPDEPSSNGFAFPVFHCTQEIPCNPCTSVCPQGLIHIDEADIRNVPDYIADQVGKACIGCTKCVSICPGLAITLVDTRENVEMANVTIPFEFGDSALEPGQMALAMDVNGDLLGEFWVARVTAMPSNDRTVLVVVEAPRDKAARIAGLRVQEPWVGEPLPDVVRPLEDEDIVCRCERITAGEIRALIQSGMRDINEIKTVTRTGMGACGGKTCQTLIARLFRECGVPEEAVTKNVPRPLFVEVALGTLAGASANPQDSDENVNPTDPHSLDGKVQA